MESIILAEGVVGKVCEMAIQQVADEVSTVRNFSQDFERLKNKIRQINYFLNEADEESTQKESVKEWLQSVRDIAWEAEDILQICAVDSMYASNTQSCTLGCRQLILRRQMGRRIQKVKARMSMVIEDGNNLNIGHTLLSRVEAAESSNTSQRRKYTKLSVLPGDSKPVGIQSKIESIVSLLDNPQFPVIAVVGMGGLGKTYLLQHVYNAQKGRYEKSAWLSVSQFYSFSNLLNDLAFQLDKDFSKEIKKSGVSEEVAAGTIYNFMQGKKCLIVLDDVWRVTRESDLLNKLGIPNGANSQCKVLVSTRSREVSANLNAKIYEMESLTKEESWRLFCVYAFPDSEENRAPESLKEVALHIVKECGNLPLAIKTTAASLASTAELSEWQSKLNKLKKVSNPTDPVMDILKLSYHSLPAHLKACFAYFAFFPEDEEIECEYLIYMWMAEGFIPTGENPWDCLHQLANLCLVEVWEEDRWGGLMKYCKIHDLLLDLARLISRENRCTFGLEDAFSKLKSVNTGGDRWCRLFLAKKDIDEQAISQMRPISPTLVRTLSLSRNTQIGGNIPATLFSGMRVLRALDLSHTNISTLPACVGDMKLLKVLNLRETEIEKVPDCVRFLKTLTYLDVSADRELEAPKWISELRCLQHLQGNFTRMPKGISKLRCLRTLRVERFLSLSMEEDGGLRIEDVGEMREIEQIAFQVDDESQLKRMEEGILAPLLKLRRLAMGNNIDGMRSDIQQFPESMSAMRDLEHLTLSDFAVPSWICCLTNLRYLSLENCHCSDYPELQEMPSLVSLSLGGNERCRELAKAFGKSGGFPHLRFFTIYDFYELEEFPEMEEGAMACLEKLYLWGCKKLNKVGEGLERLKRLKEISFLSSGTDELRETLKAGGMNWEKIKTNNSQISISL